MKKNNFKKELKQGLMEFGLSPDSFCLDQFWIYLQFLISENKKYNLTGITEIEKIISHHFLDSAAIFIHNKYDDFEQVLDLGTGAGFPGMVYKILYPGLPVFFLDSRQKRILFLQKLYNRLSLPGEFPDMLHGRAEEYGHLNEYREKFNPVVSRAVAPLNVLCEYVLPFVRPGGFMYSYKGSDPEKEINKARAALSKLGGDLVSVQKVEVPGVDSKRNIIKIKKTSSTPTDLPRRPGRPKKSPL